VRRARASYTVVQKEVKEGLIRLLSRVRGSVTNNCGFRIRLSCLLGNSFTVTITVTLKLRFPDDAT
jgi:hypothetical protein